MHANALEIIWATDVPNVFEILSFFAEFCVKFFDLIFLNL